MKQIILLISFFIVLVGCDKANLGNQNFQIISSSDRKVYRLNLKSGDVSMIEQGIMIKISEQARPKLLVGKEYETENGKVLTYLGNGNFRHKPLSEFTDKELLEELKK
jgi:hypothetical protein